MNREYHLTFCKVCNNRKKDFNKGLICSLTNDIADFSEHCPTFDLDSSELEQIRVKVQSQIDDKYAANGVEKVLGLNDGIFTRPTRSRNPKYKSAEKTHNLTFKNNVAYDKAVLVLMLFAVGYIFFVNYNDIVNSNLDDGVLLGFGVFLIIIPIFIYRAFFMEHKIKMRVTKTAIEYDGKRLNWNEIIDLGILKAKSSRVNEHKIIVGTINKGIQEINLTSLNVSPEELADIIILNTKNVLQQRV
ncbi:hypothetical protein [Winogradskyella sp. PG-2]|uniref:hypothetical protein n=1 Tax=Winogradskyella sp. PG-2 TaxID=754409 RepID=UPI0004586973|nr:hypothetical protein [Winogradskyella sp. PG-2]BAO77266.1 hypothetical protein WPG_3036 [Winogradskyella sp. PG-2]